MRDLICGLAQGKFSDLRSHEQLCSSLAISRGIKGKRVSLHFILEQMLCLRGGGFQIFICSIR
jgi:hypothetical protein